MAGEWNPRQTVLAVVAAAVIGVVGGGAIYAATDNPAHRRGHRADSGQGAGATVVVVV